MEKHAFLIIAHRNEEDLINLIKSIDFEFNDIFIHVDKKWKNCDFKRIKSSAKFSSVNFTKQRFSVVWGGDVQVKTELLLMETAISSGNAYQYLHLLSGQDLCIKSPTVLHEFFEKHYGKEFLCFCGKDWQIASLERIKYYHLNCGRNKLLNKLDKLWVLFQKFFHINRLRKSKKIILGGSNWASITYNFANYLVSEKKQILKLFSHSFCADELYKHTYAFNSQYKNNIYLMNKLEINDDSNTDMYIANMRYIDWIRGKPYTFTEKDFDDIKSSPYMFIRKVSCSNNLPSMIIKECVDKN